MEPDDVDGRVRRHPIVRREDLRRHHVLRRACCGRSGAEREHDAHRLVRAEANEAAACACGCAMRATLVRLERLEHLVLLACAPDVRARDALGRMAAELANRHATQTLPVD